MMKVKVYVSFETEVEISSLCGLLDQPYEQIKDLPEKCFTDCLRLAKQALPDYIKNLPNCEVDRVKGKYIMAER